MKILLWGMAGREEKRALTEEKLITAARENRKLARKGPFGWGLGAKGCTHTLRRRENGSRRKGEAGKTMRWFFLDFTCAGNRTVQGTPANGVRAQRE